MNSVNALGLWLTGAVWPTRQLDLSESALLDLLHAEGMTAMAAERLTHEGASAMPARLLAAIIDAARQQVVSSMLLEAENQRVLAGIEKVQDPALLLKGSALAHWAYTAPHLRACSDVDILLPSREAAERLAKALESDGYQRAGTSGELVAFELMCTRRITPSSAAEVDVHWQLVNSALFSHRFTFDELLVDSVAIPTLGPNARGLGPVHAMLHAAMHRSRNLTNGVGDRLKWLYDFVVLQKHFNPGEWGRLTALARERQLAGVTLNALEATSAMFGAAFPEGVLVELREAARGEPLDASRLDDWAYMQAQTVRALPGWGPKLRWLWQRVFPSRDYMGYLYGEQGGYAALMRERAKRAWLKWRRR